MADGLKPGTEVARATDEHTAERPFGGAPGIALPAAERASSPHAHKFRMATAALAGVAIAAVIVAVLVGSAGRGDGSGESWSTWSPTDSGMSGAREIADHIAPFYRISGVDQLDLVTVVNVSNSPASANRSSATASSSSSSGGLQVAVRPDPGSSSVSLLSGTTVAYNLCGIGTTNCAIGVGRPSSDRLLLLRRQALELALYTFKYLNGVQNVVAILPPGHTQPASTLTSKPPSGSARSQVKPLQAALLFVRGELQPWLDRPLSSTFPEQFPPTVPELPLWRSTPEAALVAQLTSRGLFTEKLVQAQDGSNLMVLEPLPPS